MFAGLFSKAVKLFVSIDFYFEYNRLNLKKFWGLGRNFCKAVSTYKNSIIDKFENILWFKSIILMK